ncbi:MAG TPA: type ISP restriction/modification enzyme [Bradyrhizobium sp.]|jgi:hypothetical protein|nr:type ISP restriction/modification enzyme [Bradyrhizobium sp.]
MSAGGDGVERLVTPLRPGVLLAAVLFRIQPLRNLFCDFRRPCSAISLPSGLTIFSVRCEPENHRVSVALCRAWGKPPVLTGQRFIMGCDAEPGHFLVETETSSSISSTCFGSQESVFGITKDAIFHYVYAVLYDPAYREKYAQNLKRDFPRISFYARFWRWVGFGEKLMALHIGYETVEPWPLERVDAIDEKSRKAGLTPKVLLKADKEDGNIQLDSETQLAGVPLEAWTYRLGNRSALEWILDQYKEKTPKDPTIREKFNTYRFADHKEKVIDLLMRVTRVSVETMAIVEAMKEEKR